MCPPAPQFARLSQGPEALVVHLEKPSPSQGGENLVRKLVCGCVAVHRRQEDPGGGRWVACTNNNIMDMR